MVKSKKQTYYEILDIPLTANQEEIEKAYRLTKKALSDNSMAVYSLFDSSETRPMLEQIEEAYVVLSSQESRSQYDKRMFGDNKVEANKKTNYIADMQEDLISTTKEWKKESKKTVDRSVDNLNRASFVHNEEFEKEIGVATAFSGDFLKKIREYRGITISEISSITRINPEYLRAIEDMSLQRLPPRVYLIGFIKQYAKMLRLDSAAVVNGYMKIIDQNKAG